MLYKYIESVTIIYLSFLNYKQNHVGLLWFFISLIFSNHQHTQQSDYKELWLFSIERSSLLMTDLMAFSQSWPWFGQGLFLLPVCVQSPFPTLPPPPVHCIKEWDTKREFRVGGGVCSIVFVAKIPIFQKALKPRHSIKDSDSEWGLDMINWISLTAQRK